MVSLKIEGVTVTTKKTINVLGVIFDTKLQWSDHVNHAIKRANSALNAIRLIKKYLKKDQILGLLTSNYYSILFYNSEIWHIPSLKPQIKQLLLSASANSLKVSMVSPDPAISFINLHKNCERATPNQMFVCFVCGGVYCQFIGTQGTG